MSMLYKQSADIIQLIDRKRGSLKDVLFGYFNQKSSTKQGSTGPVVSTKVYALVCKTLSRREILQNVMREVLHISFDERKKRFRNTRNLTVTIGNPYVCLVMLHDLLCGSRCEGGGKLKRQLLTALDKLKSAHQEFSAMNISTAPVIGDTSTKLFRCQTKACPNLPRYARIRSATADITHVSGTLINDLKIEITIPDMIWEDTFVPNLLGFSPQLANGLCNHPLVKNGTIVLQDKSSCLSVLSANITPGSVVLDCCAAPGNKTMQCMDHLQGTGYIVACEKDPVRACTLIDRLTTIGQLDGPYESALCNESSRIKNICKKSLLKRNGKPLFFTSAAKTCNSESLIVEVRVDDFLNLSGTDKSGENDSLKRIEIVILDPSCSGSGLAQHLEEQERRLHNADAGLRDRLRRLSSFQCKMLKHALKHFPKAATICYSTCSLHYMENQVVVQNALRSVNDLKGVRKNEAPGTRVPRFTVVEALPGWGKSKHVTDELRELNEEFLVFGAKPSRVSEDKGLPGDSSAIEYALKYLPGWWHHCVTCIPSIHNCRGFFLTKLCRTLTHL